MTQPAPLTDLIALARNRRRAARDALFLQTAARDDIKDRLEMVNKSFRSSAVVTPFPDIWARAFDGQKLITEAEILPFDEGRHDLVIHSLGLHWANDPVGQLIQCRRALRADGLFLGAVLGGQTLWELRSSLAQAESTLTGGLSPRVAPMAEVRDLGGLLQRAGFALPVADTVSMNVVYRSPWHLMRDLRLIGESNALNARLRHPTRRKILERAADIYSQNFPADEGGIVATFELILLTGWAPDASQQKPLRPGSAQARLADALKVDETPLPD